MFRLHYLFHKNTTTHCIYHAYVHAIPYVLTKINNRATLDSMGASMEVAKYTERLVPSSRIVSVDGVAPALPGANNFIAPSASVIGNVTIGEHSR